MAEVEKKVSDDAAKRVAERKARRAFLEAAEPVFQVLEVLCAAVAANGRHELNRSDIDRAIKDMRAERKELEGVQGLL